MEDLRGYKWSNYLNNVEASKRAVDSLDTKFISDQFSEAIGEARRLYKTYVRENKDVKDPLKNSFKGIALGSKEHVGYVLKKIGRVGKKREVSEMRRIYPRASDEIIKTIEKKHNTSKK